MKSKTKHKSIINKLRDNNLVSDDLLVLVNIMSLEDIIALKLELSSKIVKNRFYGFDIWRNSKYVVQEAMLKFAISATESKKDAARFLGLDYVAFGKLVKYVVSSIFEASNLGEDNLLSLLNTTGSYPTSLNDDSLPPSLVPVTLLNFASRTVELPGVITENAGINESYWKFCVPFVNDPPANISSVKLN